MGSDLGDRRAAWVMVFVVAATVRIAMLVSKWDQELLLNDSLWYAAQAQQLANGHGFEYAFGPGPTAEHGPLTPILLAPVSWVDAPVPWQRLVMTVLGMLTVALIGVVGTLLRGRTAGLIAAAIAAVYPNVWMSDSLVMSETPAMLAVTAVFAATLLACRSTGRRRLAWAVAAGAAVGVGTLARSELVLLAPMVAWFVSAPPRNRSDGEAGSRAWSPAVAVLAASVLVISPWVVRNLVVFSEPVLLGTNDGTTLLGANCDSTYGGPGIGGWSLLCVFDADPPAEFDASERSQRYRSLAIDHVRANVDDVPLVVVARIARAVDLYGLDNMVNGDVGEERPRWAAWAGIVSFWALALVALATIRRHDRRALALLAMPWAVVAVTTVVFYGSHRLRAPAEPALVLMVASALATLPVVRRASGRSCVGAGGDPSADDQGKGDPGTGDPGSDAVTSA